MKLGCITKVMRQYTGVLCSIAITSFILSHPSDRAFEVFKTLLLLYVQVLCTDNTNSSRQQQQQLAHPSNTPLEFQKYTFNFGSTDLFALNTVFSPSEVSMFFLCLLITVV